MPFSKPRFTQQIHKLTGKDEVVFRKIRPTAGVVDMAEDQIDLCLSGGISPSAGSISSVRPLVAAPLWPKLSRIAVCRRVKPGKAAASNTALEIFGQYDLFLEIAGPPNEYARGLGHPFNDQRVRHDSDRGPLVGGGKVIV